MRLRLGSTCTGYGGLPLDERPANRRGRPKREYPPEIIELARAMYEDQGMTVAEIRAAFPKGYRVQTILERHVASRRAAAKRDQTGERNHMWRDDPGYQAAHLRVASERARASEHACIDCDERAAEWSYDHTDPQELTDQSGRRYSADPSHYDPRCISCHRRHDAARRVVEGVMSDV